MSDAQTPTLMTEAEVFEIIHATQVNDLLLVGGQSISFWRNVYAGQSAWLSENPVASEDIDFLRNRTAAANLSDKYDVDIRIASVDDNSPSDGQLLIPMNNRSVIVDFLRSVHGVADKELTKRAVLVEMGNPAQGASLAFRVMHPFDCLVSRLSNVNGPLRRINNHSRMQTEASVHILKCHLDALIADGKQNEACKYMQALEYVIKNNHIGKNSHRLFGQTVDPIALLESYVGDDRLHPKWREKTLGPIIERLTDQRERKINRDVAAGNTFPGYKPRKQEPDAIPAPKT